MPPVSRKTPSPRAGQAGAQSQPRKPRRAGYGARGVGTAPHWAFWGQGSVSVFISPVVQIPACARFFTEGLSCPGYPAHLRLPQSLMPQANQEPFTWGPQFLALRLGGPSLPLRLVCAGSAQRLETLAPGATLRAPLLPPPTQESSGQDSPVPGRWSGPAFPACWAARTKDTVLIPLPVSGGPWHVQQDKLRAPGPAEDDTVELHGRVHPPDIGLVPAGGGPLGAPAHSSGRQAGPSPVSPSQSRGKRSGFKWCHLPQRPHGGGDSIEAGEHRPGTLPTNKKTLVSKRSKNRASPTRSSVPCCKQRTVEHERL